MSYLDGTAFQTGLILGSASVLSVGPNTIMLIREGLVRGRIGTVATVVCASYISLLFAAYILADEINVVAGPIRTAMSWLGVVAILWFAAQALKSAVGEDGGLGRMSIDRETRSACLTRVAVTVWFNPLTYVELLLVPAALCGTFQSAGSRLQFVVAIFLMTLIHTYGYSFLAASIAPLILKRGLLRLFDFISALILAGAALIVASTLVYAT